MSMHHWCRAAHATSLCSVTYSTSMGAAKLGTEITSLNIYSYICNQNMQLTTNNVIPQNVPNFLCHINRFNPCTGKLLCSGLVSRSQLCFTWTGSHENSCSDWIVFLSPWVEPSVTRDPAAFCKAEMLKCDQQQMLFLSALFLFGSFKNCRVISLFQLLTCSKCLRLYRWIPNKTRNYELFFSGAQRAWLAS